ncbi:hypothetical protein F5Y17DRAFT_462887 [Xylariaceae sp. FL0594]|nr:hypothetical protein F5Y17DRAFT_462887 [Xylariaceae sp. FL0594]
MNEKTARAGYPVYVLADGVSSCNPEEVPLALSRLRAVQGVTVTSSESWLYETMGDASIAEFRDVARLVKDTGADTKAVLSGLFGAKPAATFIAIKALQDIIVI